MASNLTSMTVEDTLIWGSAPQITSTNTAGIQTKEINQSLNISVIVPPRNISRAPYKCKNHAHESFIISQMTKEIIQQRDYFVSIGLFHQKKLYSVLCIDQCTLQYCVSLLYSVLKIFSSGFCTLDIYRFGKQI